MDEVDAVDEVDEVDDVDGNGRMKKNVRAMAGWGTPTLSQRRGGTSVNL